MLTAYVFIGTYDFLILIYISISWVFSWYETIDWLTEPIRVQLCCYDDFYRLISTLKIIYYLS